MSYEKCHDLVLSKQEAELAEEIARRKGISPEEAGTLIVKAGMARRMKKRTGKAPARVYRLPGR